MYFVIIHIFLLSIRHEDRQVQADLFICHGISATHKLIQIPDIPSNVTELLTERLPDLVCAALSAFGVGKAVFSGTPPVPSWQQQIAGSTKTVYDGLRLFPRLVQKGDILRVTDVDRRTGRIQCQRPFVPVRFWNIKRTSFDIYSSTLFQLIFS